MPTTRPSGLHLHAPPGGTAAAKHAAKSVGLQACAPVGVRTVCAVITSCFPPRAQHSTACCLDVVNRGRCSRPAVRGQAVGSTGCACMEARASVAHAGRQAGRCSHAGAQTPQRRSAGSDSDADAALRQGALHSRCECGVVGWGGVCVWVGLGGWGLGRLASAVRVLGREGPKPPAERPCLGQSAQASEAPHPAR